MEVKAAWHIGWRVSLWSVLILAVFFVPLAHSAHFHEGESNGDAAMKATCVVCQAALGHVAECDAGFDLPGVVAHQGTTPVERVATVRSILIASKASRAPPLPLQ